jgi:hypothetical protein
MEFSLSDLRELLCGQPKNHSFRIGEKYLIRTVTMHHLGQIKSVTDTDIVLEDASWLAVDCRFYNTLKDGCVDEIEPFIDDAIVARGSIVDATVWRHELPRNQK